MSSIDLFVSDWLTGWTAAARSTWTGESPGKVVEKVVVCLQTSWHVFSLQTNPGSSWAALRSRTDRWWGSPGECRLFRENPRWPSDWRRRQITPASSTMVGSRIYLRCDYQIQQYKSKFSDITGVTIWGETTTFHTENKFSSHAETKQFTSNRVPIIDCLRKMADRSAPKVKPKHLDSRLVADCSIAH